MGSRINIIGPRELVPEDMVNLYSTIDRSYKNKISYYEDFEKPILSSDFLIALRIQKERFDKNTDLNFGTYTTKWKIDLDVLRNLKREDVFLMHPGPVNEEIELSHELVHSEKSLISKQVENGVYVRQKIMEKLLNEK